MIDTLLTPRSDTSDDSTPSSPGSKRAADEDFDEPSGKAARDKPVRVCCGECGRAYQSPLDLPPVIITGVASMTPDKIERRWSSCFPSNGEHIWNYFLSELAPSSAEQLRAIHDARPDENQCVTVTMANGDSARCEITVNKWRNQATFYHFQLFLDVLPRVSSTITTAAALNPFVVGNAPVTVRTVWESLPLKAGQLGLSPCPWIRDLADDNKGYYLGIMELQFDTLTSGHFALQLLDDGPNMGSAGGPTFQTLARLYRIDFTLASARYD